MTNTDKILAEFDKEFGKFEFLHKSGNTWDENPFKDFLETSITQALAEERERVVEVEEKYQELIMAVEKKYEGETRHETALKYIRSAEKTDCGEVKNSFIDKLTDKGCDCRLDYRDKNCTTHTPHFIIDDGLSSLDIPKKNI